MATVTKAIRWGDTPIVNQNDAMTGVAGSDSSTASGTMAPNMQTLVGLKMIVDSALVREIGRGCKLFTLIPPGITTVREFKNHVSTKVLKAHIPFDFYNGDYRIPDEEDIKIFSLLNGPCAVVPVPQPKSVLSVSSVSALVGSTYRSTSTPLGMRSRLENGSGTPFAKRVKFSDTSFPLDISGFSNNSNSNEQVDAVAIVGNGIDDIIPDATTTGSKRRKRHRKHKSKKSSNNAPGETDEAIGENSEEGSPKKMNGIQIQQSQGPLLKKRKTAGTPEYDADESEMDLNLAKQKRKKSKSSHTTNGSPLAKTSNTSEEMASSMDDSEHKKSSEKPQFLSPNTAFSETGYKSIRASSSGSNKPTALKLPRIIRTSNGSGSGSGFEHSCGEAENSQNCDGIETSGKRKDTPMLPKILKNPCATFDLVKKKMSFEEASFSPATSPNRRRPVSADCQEKQLDMEKCFSNIVIADILGTLDPASQKLGAMAECQSIFMFGDYLYREPKPTAYITERGIMLIVPHYDERYGKNGVYPINDESESVTCLLSFDDISQVKCYSSGPDNTRKIVFETLPKFVKKTRNMLGLSDASKSDNLQNSIVIHLKKDDRTQLFNIYTTLGTMLLEVNSGSEDQVLFIRDPNTLEAETTNNGASTSVVAESVTDGPPKTANVISKTSPTGNNNNKEEDSSQFLLHLAAVTSVERISIGDTISFNVLELGENYNPELSSLKVAEVVKINGQVLELKYFDFGDKENKKQRNGAFEIDDEELQSEDLDNPKTRNFQELINPTYVVMK